MRVLLADKDTRVLRALRTVIREQVGMWVVGEATGLNGLVAQVRDLRPDLILLDWELSGGSARGAILTFKTLKLPLRVIVLGHDRAFGRAALSAGAHAYVSKAEPPERLLKILRDLLTEVNGSGSLPTSSTRRSNVLPN